MVAAYPPPEASPIDGLRGLGEEGEDVAEAGFAGLHGLKMNRSAGRPDFWIRP
jgi:hypothetical protein